MQRWLMERGNLVWGLEFSQEQPFRGSPPRQFSQRIQSINQRCINPLKCLTIVAPDGRQLCWIVQPVQDMCVFWRRTGPFFVVGVANGVMAFCAWQRWKESRLHDDRRCTLNKGWLKVSGSVLSLITHRPISPHCSPIKCQVSSSTPECLALMHINSLSWHWHPGRDWGPNC